jgi:hypothetical protein
VLTQARAGFQPVVLEVLQLETASFSLAVIGSDVTGLRTGFEKVRPLDGCLYAPVSSHSTAPA